MQKPKVNEKELVVLKILAGAYQPDEWGAYAFASLSRQTKLEVKDVRRACRSLARKGLAAYERGLVTEDGEMAGAGYRATEEGAALILPCDVCGQRATSEYTQDDRGLTPWDKGFAPMHSRTVRECDEHYKKSPRLHPKLV